MTPLEQYGLLAVMATGTVALVALLRILARAIGVTLAEPGKDVPFTGGTLSPRPVWIRYHVHFYVYALLFIAFDMEMAFMYPWAVVYRELGLSALLDMGVFLTVLFLGILYAWSEGGLKRQ